MRMPRIALSVLLASCWQVEPEAVPDAGHPESTTDGDAEQDDTSPEVRADAATDTSAECRPSCGINRHCDHGQCVCDDRFVECGFRCVRLGTAENCGGCNDSCLPGGVCVGGRCACPVGWSEVSGICCWPGAVVCGDECVLLGTVENCGGCGDSCPANSVCNGGLCECFSGWEVCGDGCRDLASDNDNCGGCGVECGEREECGSGECRCGGLVCGPDEVCLQTRVRGDPVHRCEQCAENETLCRNDGWFFGDACADLQTDRVRCGDCDTRCGLGEVCVDGTCELP